MPKKEDRKLLILTPAPHIKMQQDTRKIMWMVVLSLLPPIIAAVYFFGLYSLALIAVCTITAVGSEWLFLKARRKDTSAAFDGSAVITGIILALVLPPRLPLWMGAVGAAFGIIFGKQVFGGLGQNIFNPALLGRAFLMAAFPVALTTWVKPFYWTYPPDAITTATPLALAKFSHQITPYAKLFWGNTGGSLGETSAFAILIGGFFLIYRKIIDWALSFSYIGTVFVLGGILWLINPQKYPDPLFHLLAGGLLLGGFYMITDMVASPLTRKGRVVYGIIAGILVIVIRIWGGYPEGVMFSILIANAIRPWIDRIFVPRRFGTGRFIGGMR